MYIYTYDSMLRKTGERERRRERNKKNETIFKTKNVTQMMHPPWCHKAIAIQYNRRLTASNFLIPILWARKWIKSFSLTNSKYFFAEHRNLFLFLFARAINVFIIQKKKKINKNNSKHTKLSEYALWIDCFAPTTQTM